MTKLTLGKDLSLEAQAKLEQLTQLCSASHQRIQPSQMKGAQSKAQTSQQIPNSSFKSDQNQNPKTQQVQTHTKDKTSQMDQDAKERLQRQLSHKAFLTAYRYLYETYPQAFDKQDPKPLKLHIEKDIYPHLPANISRIRIRKVLSAYTRRIIYLQAFGKYTQRIDLSGAFVEEITEIQSQHAAHALEDALIYLEKKRQYTQNKQDKPNA